MYTELYIPRMLNDHHVYATCTIVDHVHVQSPSLWSLRLVIRIAYCKAKHLIRISQSIDNLVEQWNVDCYAVDI